MSSFKPATPLYNGKSAQQWAEECADLRAEKAALLEALRGMLSLDEENNQRGSDDADTCKEVRDAYAAVAALAAKEGS